MGVGKDIWTIDFYPRPPRGGRRSLWAYGMETSRDFYPRPPRGGRPSDLYDAGVGVLISIHALREEGDILSCVK